MSLIRAQPPARVERAARAPVEFEDASWKDVKRWAGKAGSAAKKAAKAATKKATAAAKTVGSAMGSTAGVVGAAIKAGKKERQRQKKAKAAAADADGEEGAQELYSNVDKTWVKF